MCVTWNPLRTRQFSNSVASHCARYDSANDDGIRLPPKCQLSTTTRALAKHFASAKNLSSLTLSTKACAAARTQTRTRTGRRQLEYNTLQSIWMHLKLSNRATSKRSDWHSSRQAVRQSGSNISNNTNNNKCSNHPTNAFAFVCMKDVCTRRR